MISGKRTKALAAAAVAATAGMAAAPASASASTSAAASGFVPKAAERPAVPDTIHNCTPVTNGVTLCGIIVGEFNIASEIALYSACVIGAGQWIHGEILSPKGHYKNSVQTYYRSNGGCIPIVYWPSLPNTVNTGPWKFRVWRLNANHTQTLIDHLSLTVQP